jgi:peptidyl-prolyl cis-trans isomerase D
MLEQLRKSGASIFIYLIFGLLIVIFVINFAPNAGKGEGGGCSGTTNTVITVDGTKANQSAYHVAYSQDRISFFQRTEGKSRVQTYNALELLIRRELLAQAANDYGIQATTDLVNEEIKKGNFFVGGFRIPLTNYIFDEVDGEKFYNHGKFKRWVNQLNVSQGSYIDEQKRSLQAALMAELLQDSVRVSREEALAMYLFENNTITYDVVGFSPQAYRDAMRLTDADVQRFLAGHEDEVKAKFKADERTYKGTKPALKLRSIFIAKAQPAAAPAPDGDKQPAPEGDKKAADKKDDKKDDKKPAAGDAPKPVGLPIEEAKAKLEAARTAIAGGKQKFADAAKQLSTDDAAKLNGGDMGWRSVENAQLGDKAVNDAVKALKPGEMTPVIVTDNGAYLVMADDKREGDLSYDQVKAEIASDLAKDVWSKEAAKRAALQALQAANSGKTLDSMFEREVDKDEERLRYQKQIQEQMEKANQHGSIEYESKDVPAGWSAADEKANGSAAGSATGSAAGGAAPGSASGSAAGSAAGSGAGSAAAPVVPPPPAVDPMAPSKDELPAFAPVKPKVIGHGPTPRQKAMPGVGTSESAISAMFDELSPGMVAKKVYESDGNYIVLQVKAKDAPKVADFDKIADAQVTQLRALRGRALLEDWLKSRCEALAKDGKIKPMAELIRETDDAGKPLPPVYRPCMSFR